MRCVESIRRGEEEGSDDSLEQKMGKVEEGRSRRSASFFADEFSPTNIHGDDEVGGKEKEKKKRDRTTLWSNVASTAESRDQKSNAKTFSLSLSFPHLSPSSPRW